MARRRSKNESEMILRKKGLKEGSSGVIRPGLPSCDVIGFLAIQAWGKKDGGQEEVTE